MMPRYVCIHCHFYQPPRENPWLEFVELQDSAYPYHDWNERIMAECYAPNAEARILDTRERIQKIVSNYASISFNFGPTLLSWMKDKAPEGYQLILDADRESAAKFSGHGSAIAQCYNHMIQPLANSRDKYTQVYWGIEDFRSRFDRMPEGMWLPETAVDLETLDIMAGQGIRYTILAPSQVKSVGGQDARGGRVDPTRPYRVKLPSGRSIAVFFYDGPISQAVAFERLLNNGEKFANRILGAFNDGREWPQLSHIATDGETYGHHHRHGDMALAYAMHYISSNKLAQITNYGEFLEKHPPEIEAEVIENTAWSCVHGVGRWSRNCGCCTGSRPGWNQEWRAPLRQALDWLRDSILPHFEERGGQLFKDPWEARNEYIRVILDRSPENRAAFGERHFQNGLSEQDQVQAWKLLEMQRHAMLMYTSCGWFFDDISGIETVQVILYAARVLQIAREVFGAKLEKPFIDRLSRAHSNVAERGDGAKIYRTQVKPSIVNLTRLAAHYAISSLFEQYSDHARIYSYSVEREDYSAKDAGKLRIAIGKARFTSEVTQRSELLIFGVMHFGDHNIHAGIRPFVSDAAYQQLSTGLRDAFARADLAEVIRLMDRGFGTETYSLKDLFTDEQRKLVNEVLKSTLGEAEAAYRQLYDNHAPLLRFLSDAKIPIPRQMQTTAEYALNSLLRSALCAEELDFDRIENYMDEAAIAGVKLDSTTLEFTLRRRLERMADQLFAAPEDMRLLVQLRTAVQTAKRMPFDLVLWAIQNKCYYVRQANYPKINNQAACGDTAAQAWLIEFDKLSELLRLGIPGPDANS